MINKTLDKTYDPKQFEKTKYNDTLDKFKISNEYNNSDFKYFSLLMPPPNVTGSLHLGHALTYTIQDILVRYHRQNGYDTLWQAGMDHAGIATQMVVERDLESNGINPKELTKQEFISKVYEWKNKSGSKISDQQKALGCSANWDLSRFTMDDGFCKSVINAFVTLYKDGLIYRAKRLVNWDTKLKTAISDLEIQNKEEKGTLWYIKYKIKDSDDEFINIATTRPETIFADTAIAVHPDDSRYKKLVGKYAIIPYSSREIKIIADDYVDIEKGSGCLKVTPAHDHNDFAIGKRHNLDSISVLDKDGHIISSSDYDIPDFLQGLYVKKARKVIVQKLKDDEILVKEESILHSVPYGDRSGTVIEPFLTDQWFLDAKKLSVDAKKVVENGDIKFYPDKWKNTYFDWMNNIEPWCISRQIIWGHQIPAWYGPNGEIFVEKTQEEAEKEANKLGISKDQLTRETDVLDTWFSSGLWPFATLGWPFDENQSFDNKSSENSSFKNKLSESLSDKNQIQKNNLLKYYPTSTLVTGFDIIFFWVARMIMMSMYFMKEIPFKDIYIHALVRDEKGQKMSKSKGNVIDPLELMDQFGTDALRFTLAFLSVPGRDIKFGKENVKVSRNFITKIWNAARFLQSKEVKFYRTLDKNINITKKLNHWIIAKLKSFQNEIKDNIKDYRFDYATRNIQFFIRDTFCDFFVEAMKFQDDDETKSIAGFVFAEFLKISHPIIPFVTDHLADILDICDSFVLEKWSDINNININKEYEKEVNEFLELIHKTRSQKQSSGSENSDSEDYLILKDRLHNWDGELKNIAQIIR